MKYRMSYEAYASNDNHLPFKLRPISMKVGRIGGAAEGYAVVVQLTEKHGEFGLLKEEAPAFAAYVSGALKGRSDPVWFTTKTGDVLSFCVVDEPPSRHRPDLMVRVKVRSGRPGYSIYLSREEMARFAGDIRAFGEEAA